jgi:hypothetical protein
LEALIRATESDNFIITGHFLPCERFAVAISLLFLASLEVEQSWIYI